MKKITLVLLTLFIGLSAYSQGYKTGFGLRTGTSFGVSIKHFISKPGAVEAILDIDVVSQDEMKIKASGYYEYHFDVNVDGLSLFAGGGASAGVHIAGLYSKQFLVSFDAIGGVEYKFPNVPIALSADWNPRIQLISNPGFKAPNFGFTIRYTL